MSGLFDGDEDESAIGVAAEDAIEVGAKFMHAGIEYVVIALPLTLDNDGDLLAVAEAGTGNSAVSRAFKRSAIAAGAPLATPAPAQAPAQPDPVISKQAHALAQAAGTGGAIGMLQTQLDRAIDKGKLPVLGAVVWWTFSGIETTVDELRAKVQQAGLDPAIVPVPEPRGALTDGIKSLGIKCRIGRHKIDGSKFAISLEKPQVTDQGGVTVNVDYQIDQVVQYDFDTKSLAFKTGMFETEIRSAYAKYLTALQSSDLRTAVMRTLAASNAITCRERGGVYFVPRAALDVVEKIRVLCDSIPGAQITRLRIADEPEERASMLRDAGAEIEGEIQAAEAELTELLDRVAKGETKVRGDTLDRRMASFTTISTKALAYKDLLNYKAEDVEARLATLRAKVDFVMETL